MKLFWKDKPLCDPLLTEIDETLALLRIAENRYDFLTDPALLDALCLEIKSLQLRYDGLLRQAKKQKLRREPFFEQMVPKRNEESQ